MNKFIFTTCALTALSFSFAADSRPVSYPEGWTVMEMHDQSETSLHIHYSPTVKYSLGFKGIHLRDKDATLGALQVNQLLKRWNMPAAQANIYLKSGAGAASNEETLRAAAFTGLALDIEDRRFFASYENRILTAGSLDKSFRQSVRFGVAPYIAEYGALHTWAMVQMDHTPGEYHDIDVKPLLRFFKGTSLVEIGTSLRGGLTLNFIQRF